MIFFEEAELELTRTMRMSAVYPQLESVTVIRDLRARFSLYLEFKAGSEIYLDGTWSTDAQNLRSSLSAVLGPYWAGNLWRKGKKDNIEKALGEEVTRLRHQIPSNDGCTWYRVERHYSKSSWTHEQLEAWPLEGDVPLVASFFSFKGGVGRSTALAAAAMILAHRGLSVAVIDLDLEAPGLSNLLAPGTTVDRGVMDYLLASSLERPRQLGRFYIPVTERVYVGERGGSIKVFPAGKLDEHYLEKLARLDFEQEGAKCLKGLLEHIKDEIQTDLVLIDCRSGLHDIGGLSLNGLSHLNVLVSTDSQQNWQGLVPVVQTLAKHERDIWVLYSLAMVNFVQNAEVLFRTRCYELLRENYYSVNEDVPDIEDEQAPYGSVIPFREGLMAWSNPEYCYKELKEGEGYHKLADVIQSRLPKELP